MFFPVSILTTTKMLNRLKRFSARKSVLLLVFIPYVFLLGIFHSRLNMHIKTTEDMTNDDVRGTRMELTVRQLQQTDMLRVQQRQLQRAAVNKLVSILQNNSLLVHEKTKQALRQAASIRGTNHHTDPLDIDKINARTEKRSWITLGRDVRFPAGEMAPSSQQGLQPFFSPTECNAIPPDEPSFQLLQHLYVYSAYYDDRRRNTPYIRVIALAPSRDRPQLYCHFTGRENRTTAISYYEMCENHSHKYGGWILSCPVPLVQSPPKTCAVIVSTSEDPADGGVVLNVRSITTMSTKRRFGVCVPPLFGDIPVDTLVQFIELSKLLGAQHFYFYAHDVTEDIKKVLYHYELDDTTTVIRWVLPVRAVDKVWYHGQLLAINDCLYRGMSAFKFLAINDIDEFIVPHAHIDWNTMLRATQKDPHLSPTQCSGYSFQSAFFDQLLIDDNNDNHIGYNLASDLRTKAFSRIRSKVLVESRKIFELGIHHISKPIIDKYQPCMVNPDLAFVHHYRKCTSDFEPNMNCAVFKRDNATLRYAAKLNANVKNVISTLSLQTL